MKCRAKKTADKLCLNSKMPRVLTRGNLLDMHYYNRLLEGTVDAILNLEKNKNGLLRKKEINLSSNIENAFSQHFDHEDKYWFKRMFLGGRNGFYLFVFIGLLIPCVFCFIMWLR